MYRNFLYSVCLIFSINMALSAENMPKKRRPYNIPLPQLTYSFNSNSNDIEVMVIYEGAQERWEITSGNDHYLKDTRKIRLDHVYRELPSQAAFISVFEAGVLAEVCRSLEATILILEKDLKYERWDRCLFLDAYFPNFLKRFYYLYSAALASTDVLPPVCQINDTLFESSEVSPKSDQRIGVWCADTSQIMKLRISSKEFAHQLSVWRKNVLLNPDRDLWENQTGDLIKVYELFVRLYFNLPKAKERL